MTIENAQAIAETVVHWKRRAEVAEAEVERLRSALNLISTTLASTVKVSEILLEVVTLDVTSTGKTSR